MLSKANVLFGVVLALLVALAGEASAVGIFPVDTASAADLVLIRGDIVAWGVAILALGIAFLAYKRIARMVH